MNLKSNPITDLRKTAEILSENVHQKETELGKKLLENKSSSLLSANISLYNSYKSDIERMEKDIIQINDLQKNTYDLNGKIKEINENIKELNTGWPELYLKLGEACFNNYDSSISTPFFQYFGLITSETKLQSSIQNSINQNETSMESQGFFSKILTQTKISINKTSLSSHQKKIENLETKGGQAVFENQTIKELYENSSLNDSISHCFDQCNTLKDAVLQKQNEIQKINEELDSVFQKLSLLGVTSSVSKRVEDLREEINKTEKNQEDFCAVIGLEYSNNYISTEGKQLSDFDSEYKADLSLLQEKKLELVSLNRKIELLQISAQIEEKEKQILKLQQVYTDNDHKIETLKMQNDQIQVSIESIKEEKDELYEKKRKIEKQESYTSMLLSDGEANPSPMDITI